MSSRNFIDDLSPALAEERHLYFAMLNGIENDMIHGIMLDAGVAQRVTEAVATPNWAYGAKLTKPDGRIYRYARATNIISDRT